MTATAAASVAVKMPARMPVMMITITNRPGIAAAAERITAGMPGNTPAG
jgi:hypothetical protein